MGSVERQFSVMGVTHAVKTVTWVLTVFTHMSYSLDCHTHQAEVVTCDCQEKETVFQWSSIEPFNEDPLHILPTLIKFESCTKLVLDLVPPHPEPLPVIVADNMEEVVMSVSMVTINITLANVTHLVLLGQQDVQSDLIYFYLSIGLGTLCGVFLIMFIIASIITRAKLRKNSEHKKVSRAESWRYEPSLYINHPVAQKPVYVAPPLPPPSSPSDSGPPTWSRPPNSLSSSPLLRAKNNSSLAGVRGVDIIRTSLPSQQERQEKEKQRKITYHGPPIINNRDMISVQRNETIARLDKLEDEIDSNTVFRESVTEALDTDDEDQETYEAST